MNKPSTTSRMLSSITPQEIEYWTGQYNAMLSRQRRAYADKKYPIISKEATAERQVWWDQLEADKGPDFITDLLDSLT